MDLVKFSDQQGKLPEPPKSLKAAKGRPDYEAWVAAAIRDITAKKANDSWELVDRPKNGHVIKSGFVFTNKTDPETNCILDGDAGFRARGTPKYMERSTGRLSLLRPRPRGSDVSAVIWRVKIWTTVTLTSKSSSQTIL